MKMYLALAAFGILAAAGCGGSGNGRPSGTIPLTEPTYTEAAASIESPPAAPAPTAQTATSVQNVPVRTEVRAEPEAASRPASAPAPEILSSRVVLASVLQVNQQFITVEEVVLAAGEELNKISDDQTAGEFRQQVQQVLSSETRRRISEAIVLDEAQRNINDAGKKAIDEEIKDTERHMIAQLGEGSRKQLERALEAQGVTLESTLESYRRRLTVREYLRQKFAASLQVTAPILWEYYRGHQEEFSTPARFQIQTIGVTIASKLNVPESRASRLDLAQARNDARRQIEKAQADLKAGNDFAEVAKTYSVDSKADEGGIWPPMEMGTLRDREVETTAFSQKPGQVSEIIETPRGFFLVKTLEVQPRVTRSFEQSQGDIEQKVRRKSESELTEQYFKKLMAETSVISYDKFIELATDRAMVKHYKPKS